MRKLILVILFLTFVVITKSQNLTVEGTAPDLYLTHIVAPKENFYSVARLYNQPPKAIASYNKIAMEKGLTIGQKVRIPLTTQNFDVSDNANAGETLIPITHIVSKSETLFKIAGNNKATAELIKKWNNLTSNNIKPGTPLVIGHLKVNKDQASSLKNSSLPVEKKDILPTGKTGETTETNQRSSKVEKEDPSLNTASSEEQKGKLDESDGTPNSQIPSKTEKISSSSSSDSLVKDTALAVVPQDPKKSVEETSLPTKEKPSKQEETRSKTGDDNKSDRSSTISTANSTEGAFASLFDLSASQKTLNTKNGEAATFKSTSGWQDKKYYVLMSNVAPGTILKISSTENKVIYAKVLGSMPEMKENDGLLLRISNAAASDLGIIDPRFPVQVSYYQ